MKISVCLPTYKGAHVLGMPLEGIFNQDYQDFEILIGDDNPPGAFEHRQAALDVVSRFFIAFRESFTAGVFQDFLIRLIRQYEGRMFLIMDRYAVHTQYQYVEWPLTNFNRQP